MQELDLTECEISFIGCSGSNPNAFYLYTSNISGFATTSCYVHAWLLKGCG